MLRSPGWPGTDSKRPRGSSLRSRTASRRSVGEPAGRGPSSTWRRSSANARRPSKRSTLSRALDAARTGASSWSNAPLTAATNPPTISTAVTPSAIARPLTPRSVVGGHRLEQLGEARPRRLPARGHVLGGDAVRRRLVTPQDLARDALAVDLVGAVVEARRAREAVHRLERQVGRVAERAVDLQGAVDHVVHDARAVELDQ